MRRVVMVTGSWSSPWRRRAQLAARWRNPDVHRLPNVPAVFMTSDGNGYAAGDVGDERGVIRGRGDGRALEPMRCNRREYRLHVLGQREIAARKQRPGTRRAHQALAGTRRETYLDVAAPARAGEQRLHIFD